MEEKNYGAMLAVGGGALAALATGLAGFPILGALAVGVLTLVGGALIAAFANGNGLEGMFKNIYSGFTGGQSLDGSNAAGAGISQDPYGVGNATIKSGELLAGALVAKKAWDWGPKKLWNIRRQPLFDQAVEIVNKIRNDPSHIPDENETRILRDIKKDKYGVRSSLVYAAEQKRYGGLLGPKHSGLMEDISDALKKGDEAIAKQKEVAKAAQVEAQAKAASPSPDSVPVGQTADGNVKINVSGEVRTAGDVGASKTDVNAVENGGPAKQNNRVNVSGKVRTPHAAPEIPTAEAVETAVPAKASNAPEPSPRPSTGAIDANSSVAVEATAEPFVPKNRITGVYDAPPSALSTNRLLPASAVDPLNVVNGQNGDGATTTPYKTPIDTHINSNGQVVDAHTPPSAGTPNANLRGIKLGTATGVGFLAADSMRFYNAAQNNDTNGMINAGAGVGLNSLGLADDGLRIVGYTAGIGTVARTTLGAAGVAPTVIDAGKNISIAVSEGSVNQNEIIGKELQHAAVGVGATGAALATGSALTAAGVSGATGVGIPVAVGIVVATAGVVAVDYGNDKLNHALFDGVKGGQFNADYERFSKLRSVIGGRYGERIAEAIKIPKDQIDLSSPEHYGKIAVEIVKIKDELQKKARGETNPLKGASYLPEWAQAVSTSYAGQALLGGAAGMLNGFKSPEQTQRYIQERHLAQTDLEIISAAQQEIRRVSALVGAVRALEARALNTGLFIANDGALPRNAKGDLQLNIDSSKITQFSELEVKDLLEHNGFDANAIIETLKTNKVVFRNASQGASPVSFKPASGISGGESVEKTAFAPSTGISGAPSSTAQIS